MCYLEISKELYHSLTLLITSSMLARFTKWMLVVLLHFSMVSVSNRKRKRKEGIRQNYGLTSLNLMMMKLNLILERTRTNRHSILMILMMVQSLSVSLKTANQSLWESKIINCLSSASMIPHPIYAFPPSKLIKQSVWNSPIPFSQEQVSKEQFPYGIVGYLEKEHPSMYSIVKTHKLRSRM